MSIKDAFADIEKRIKEDPEKTKSEIDGIFRFEVTGDQAGTWIVDCKDVDVREADDEGECTITIADTDLLAVLSGELDPMQAFMMGQIQVEGDMALSLKLQEVFQGS